MHDESDASVEFVEPPRLQQCSLTGLFGKIAGKLPAHDLEQIEILPVELSLYQWSGQYRESNEAIEMEQWDDCPSLPILAQPLRYQNLFATMVDVFAQLIQRDNQLIRNAYPRDNRLLATLSLEARH